MSSISRAELSYKAMVFLLALVTQIYLQIEEFKQNPGIAAFARYRYLTNQSNIFVIVLFGLFILWRNDESKLKRLEGKMWGAVVSYITLVMIAYHLLLSKDDIGFWSWTNLSLHYIVPTMCIIDWAIWERSDYHWVFLKEWILYPVFYAIFVVILGVTGLDKEFVYNFLDAYEYGWGSTIGYIIIIFAGYLSLASGYILINQRFLTNSNK